MTTIDIIEKYLRENGYDGLYSPGECACKLGELAPCDSVTTECEPGYLCSPEGTEWEGKCDWIIRPKKERGE